MKQLITVDEFIIRKQQDLPYATGELSGLLRDICLACKIISREVNKAGLADIIGLAGVENASGETVQKLDILADEILQACLQNSGECCGIASEEQESFVAFENCKKAKYVVAFDPLDGSSNIDVNVSIGTIFAIYRRNSLDGPCTLEDFLQDGAEQVAAGYVLYGSSTMLVYTTGQGVNGFTLDPSIGEFCLSHPDIKIPESKNYSVNQSRYKTFPEGVRRFIDDCVEEDMRFRYTGSMVADVHRTLIKGGIFMYPSSPSSSSGKLRLLYECNPMAFVIEQAGGAATNGQERIMELEIQQLHQRTPVYIGSKGLVERLSEKMELLPNF
ncbi:class 1 fructose-bisphosphatase [Saprospira grandis]|uniref:Fructose-1,6-bisphosphatase class 1 n=1 Tax=Saprospira grandis (strain Lewin) TaxID=984262 RepID=H6L3C9_SAPGL|nr:class 1 fructose-bisphosphatase [Saprospira grandis]AFC23776.1 fructose-1,6-bisphosphatase [Saprospira grandis str. Lewin]